MFLQIDEGFQPGGKDPFLDSQNQKSFELEFDRSIQAKEKKEEANSENNSQDSDNTLDLDIPEAYQSPVEENQKYKELFQVEGIKHSEKNIKFKFDTPMEQNSLDQAVIIEESEQKKGNDSSKEQQSLNFAKELEYREVRLSISLRR